ncbi:MAG: ATP-dependent helicase/nuclease subunit A [Gammaproteobacteria bacterium]|jgi:ATP-dependent helicase/nuclease subunit A
MTITHQLPDLEQRQLAIQPDASFIVQAPAGSGKTGLLIQRYLKLLSLVDNPEEVIAITFTRKAAAEMQDRILTALDEASRDVQVVDEYEIQTLALARDALRQNKKQGWQLIENPGRLRVQTIDSFCASLIKQMPLLSQIGGMQNIIDKPGPVYEQAAEATLLELESSQAWGDSITRLLVHLDNDLPRLKSLIVGMLQKRDQWLRYVLDGYQQSDLETTLVNLLTEKLTHLCSLFPENLAEELCVLLRFATENLAELKPDSDIIACTGIQSLPDNDPQSLDVWLGIAEFLTTTAGTWRIRLDKNLGFPAAGSKAINSEINAQMKDRMKALLDQLQNTEGLERILAEMKTLPPAQISDDEWEIVDALCRLLTLAATQLQVIFNERNQQDFIGISQSAVTALGTDDTPTDLAMYLDYQVKHILVDEFQDISVNQHELIKRLTVAWIEDDGRTLFLVGDPMQSIYRFREAEVGNFIHTFHQQQLGNISLQPLVLSANFRSEAGLVNWVNSSFQNILADNDDLTTGAVRFHPSVETLTTKEKNNVNIHPLFDDIGTSEASQVVQLIEDIQTEDSAGEIAILVRTRSHLLEILPRLRDAGIACQAIDIEALGDKSSIQDVLSLTRAWLYPTDRIAWLSILRAPWCGIDLKNLLILAGTDRHALIGNRLQDESILAECDEFTRARVGHFAGVFTDVNSHRHRQSVRQSVESLWIRLGGPATLKEQSDIADVTIFFELLEKLDRGCEIHDVQILINEVTQLFGKTAPGLTSNTVKVMTMHKSKGLEFDHVILPGLGRIPRHSSTELMKWMLRPREDGGHDLFLGAIKETGQEHAPIYQYIQNIEKLKDGFETQRLLYVATTRAKKTLHLFGRVKRKQNKKGEWECSPDSRSLLGYLWPVVEGQFHAEMDIPTQNNDAPVLPEKKQIRRLKSSWALPALTDNLQTQGTIDLHDVDLDMERIEYEWAGVTIKRVGIVVHRCIQWIAKEGVEAWDDKRIIAMTDQFNIMLKQQCLAGEELQWGLNQVTSALSKMLMDERGRWVLSREHHEPQNELSITGVHEQKLVTAIIDRTFIDKNGIRWIVDYKSSRHEGSDLDQFLDQEKVRYERQLNKYGDLMSVIDSRPIRLGLYFPLLQAWREWDFKREG